MINNTKLTISGVDFTMRDKSNVTPLLMFVWQSKPHAISTLLRNGVMPEQQKHPGGLTFIHALAHMHCSPDQDILKEFVETAGLISLLAR